MRRVPNGFTLIELLVVVIIIGILATISMANFIAARDKAAAAGVRENMHTAQVASEGYHTSTALYADTPGKLDPFFPNGAFSVGGTAGNRGNNPYTQALNQALYTESFVDVAAINAARAATPSAGGGTPGQIGYCMTADGESFAVCGLDKLGFRLSNSTGGAMVLSNQ